MGTVYSHAEFCEEELKVEAAVRAVLSSHGAKLESYWGALTVRQGLGVFILFHIQLWKL